MINRNVKSSKFRLNCQTKCIPPVVLSTNKRNDPQNKNLSISFKQSKAKVQYFTWKFSSVSPRDQKKRQIWPVQQQLQKSFPHYKYPNPYYTNFRVKELVLSSNHTNEKQFFWQYNKFVKQASKRQKKRLNSSMINILDTRFQIARLL